jgi:hypothetical protein
MLHSWDQQGDKSSSTVADDTIKLTLNILNCAGFGKSSRFHTSNDGPSPRYSMTFQGPPLTVLQDLLLVAVIPHNILSIPFSPKKLTRVSRAVEEYKRHMIGLLSDERKLISR